MTRVLLYTVIATVFATHAIADDEQTKLSRKFVDLLRYRDQFVQYQTQCIATQRTVSPEALVGKNPEYFGGIRPGQPKWPAIVEAYERYFKAACSRPTEQEFLGALARAYEGNLSPSQLRSAIAFYSSPTGQSLILAHRKASSAVYEAWTKINSEHLTTITADFQREVVNLTSAK